MLRRKGLATAAICAAATAALAGGTRAWGADAEAATDSAATPATFSLAPSSSPASDNLTSDGQPVLLQNASSTAAPIKPLQSILNYTPLGKPLGNLGIAATGYVEGSWTYAAPPYEPVIAGRTFDFEPQSILLDQLELDLARPVDTTQNHFDIGFNVEQIYGADAALIHSNGLTTYSPSKILGAYTSGGIRQPKNQYDLTQAFLQFALPVGNGIGITIGKFDALEGYEVIDGPLNPFYSHSFLFTQLPFTHLGGLISYNLSKDITLTAGATRGWDQSLKDTNSDWDITGQLKYTHDKLGGFINFITGNEYPSGAVAPNGHGLDGWRSVVDLIGTYNYSDNLTLAVNGDYGWQAQSLYQGLGGGTAQWYGVAAYGAFQVSSQLTINLRGEWFDDPDGGAVFSFNPGVANQYYEATLNAKITPFPNNAILSNLVFRPEVRYDYAAHPTWDAGTKRNQMTVAVEGYFTF